MAHTLLTIDIMKGNNHINMEVYMKHTCMVGAVIIILLSAAAHATVWYVHPDSTQNRIQDCLDQCAVNDTVLVGPGIYYENLVWPSTRGIDLISQCGPNVTVIDGSASGSVIAITTGVNKTTTIKGFTITNGAGTPDLQGYLSGGGFYCAASSPTIVENIITKNTTRNEGSGGGIFCYMSSPVIVSNIIAENFSSYRGGGIYCYHDCSPEIQNNTITENKSYWQGTGITCLTNSSPVITGNTITKNVSTNACIAAILIADNSTASIHDNIIQQNAAKGNVGGIAVYINSHATITDNMISKNTAKQGSGGGIGVNEFSTAHLAGNTITDNKALQLGGGIVIGYGSSVTAGTNTIRSNCVNGRGGGLAIGYECNVQMENNDIIDNRAHERGGGIAMGYFSTLSLSGCTIARNSGQYGGGMGCWDNCVAIIDSCLITENNGDGIYCTENCSLIINYNNICDNTGFGVHNTETAVVIDATYNWWGDASGPGGFGPGTGDEVSDNVIFNPWLTAPYMSYDACAGAGACQNNITMPYQDPCISFQNSPNPFRHTTNFQYVLTSPAHVAIEIYNQAGQRIATLTNAKHPAGVHSVTWDGSDHSHRQQPAGVYFARLRNGNHSETKKILLVK